MLSWGKPIAYVCTLHERVSFTQSRTAKHTLQEEMIHQRIMSTLLQLMYAYNISERHNFINRYFNRLKIRKIKTINKLRQKSGCTKWFS